MQGRVSAAPLHVSSWPVWTSAQLVVETEAWNGLALESVEASTHVQNRQQGCPVCTPKRAVILGKLPTLNPGPQLKTFKLEIRRFGALGCLGLGA